MGNKRKIVKTVLLVIMVLVLAVVVSIYLFGNIALKTGIETAASNTLKVKVSIGRLDLSILGGKVGIRNLIINNPPGYGYERLLEVGDARIAVRIGSLLTDTVEVREIMLDNVNVTLEQKGVTGNNIQDVIKAIPAAEGDTKKPAKKLHIGTLEITNITVKAKLLPIPGKADTVTLKLKPIRMTDLGGDNKLDTAKLSGEIMMAIAAGIAEQGAGLLPEDMTGAMKETLNKTAEMGKAVTEEGKKILEKI